MRRGRRDESISPRRSQSRGPLIIQRDQTLALARYPHPLSLFGIFAMGVLLG